MPESLFEDFSETLDHDTLGVTECEEEMEDWARGQSEALRQQIGSPRYYTFFRFHFQRTNSRCPGLRHWYAALLRQA